MFEQLIQQESAYTSPLPHGKIIKIISLFLLAASSFFLGCFRDLFPGIALASKATTHEQHMSESRTSCYEAQCSTQVVP